MSACDDGTFLIVIDRIARGCASRSQCFHLIEIKNCRKRSTFEYKFNVARHVAAHNKTKKRSKHGMRKCVRHTLRFNHTIAIIQKRGSIYAPQCNMRSKSSIQFNGTQKHKWRIGRVGFKRDLTNVCCQTVLCRRIGRTGYALHGVKTRISARRRFDKANLLACSTRIGKYVGPHNTNMRWWSKAAVNTNMDIIFVFVIHARLVFQRFFQYDRV